VTAVAPAQTGVFDELPLGERVVRFERMRGRFTADEQREFIIFRLGPSHPEFGASFMRYFLPHYCSAENPDTGENEWVPFADWHHEFFQLVFTSLGAGTFHTELAPRGYAKSTIVGVATILAVLGLSGLAIEGKLPYPFKPRHYCWLVQDTSLQAAQSMQSIITECEDNPRVRRWFPHLRPARDAKNMPIADRDDDVVFELGLRLQALGAGQKLRGRRHRQFRPDFALIDDLENDETVMTKYQRDKLDKWLSSAFVFALAKGADVHYVGTLLHNDAVLARIRKRGGWRNHRYDAFRKGETMPCPEHGWRVEPEDPIEPDTLDEEGVPCDLCRGKHEVPVPTWAYRDAYWHAAARKRSGRVAYAREVLHIVTEEERKRFPAAWFTYGPRLEPIETVTEDENGEKIRKTKGVSVRIGVDPNASDKEQNDPYAIVVVMKRQGERKFHVDRAIGGHVRGKKLRELIVETWRDYRQMGYRPIVVFEKVQAQEWGVQELEDDGIPVVGVSPSKDKITRAEGASLHYEMRRVQHAEHLKDSDFEEVLDEFPDGENDDYVDAAVYAIDALEEGGDPGGGVAGAVVTSSRDRKRAGKDEKPFVDPRFA
jgi:predicted phage terminase large subunit-like protein